MGIAWEILKDKLTLDFVMDKYYIVIFKGFKF